MTLPKRYRARCSLRKPLCGEKPVNTPCAVLTTTAEILVRAYSRSIAPTSSSTPTEATRMRLSPTPNGIHSVPSCTIPPQL